jgi:hypothetical protein
MNLDRKGAVQQIQALGESCAQRPPAIGLAVLVFAAFYRAATGSA